MRREIIYIAFCDDDKTYVNLMKIFKSHLSEEKLSESKTPISDVKNKLDAFNFANTQKNQVNTFELKGTKICYITLNYLSPVNLPLYKNIVNFFEDYPYKGYRIWQNCLPYFKEHTVSLKKIKDIPELSDEYWKLCNYNLETTKNSVFIGSAEGKKFISPSYK